LAVRRNNRSESNVKHRLSSNTKNGQIMKAAVLKETFPGERRVSLVPATVPQFVKAGLEVLVQAGAGDAAGFRDAEYAAKGGTMVGSRADAFAADGGVPNGLGCRLHPGGWGRFFAHAKPANHPEAVAAASGDERKLWQYLVDQTRLLRTAQTAAWVRSLHVIFRNRFCTCSFTVSTLISSARPISRLLNPKAT